MSTTRQVRILRDDPDCVVLSGSVVSVRGFTTAIPGRTVLYRAHDLGPHPDDEFQLADRGRDWNSDTFPGPPTFTVTRFGTVAPAFQFRFEGPSRPQRDGRALVAVARPAQAAMGGRMQAPPSVIGPQQLRRAPPVQV